MNLPGLARKLLGNWFLIGLCVVVVVGIVFSDGLGGLAEVGWLRTGIVFGVMWLMAAPVPLESVQQTLRRPAPGLLAAVINMGLVPLLALCVSPLLVYELSGGLLVAATVPSTLASAAVWTRRAGGDDTVAIFVTLLTNLSCVVITPLWLVALLGVHVELDPSALIRDLAWVVMVPIGLAQLMRLSRRFSAAAESQRERLATICQVGILVMVLLGSIQMGQRLSSSSAGLPSSSAGLPGSSAGLPSSSAGLPGGSAGAQLDMTQLAILIGLASLVHVAALGLAWYLAKALGIERPQQIAVALSGSQKTLMVGLKLAMDCGVSILPMVVYHVSQLLMDTLFVQRWRAGNNERRSASLAQFSADQAGVVAAETKAVVHGGGDGS